MIFKSLKKKTEKKLKHTNFNCGCVFFDTPGIKKYPCSTPWRIDTRKNMFRTGDKDIREMWIDVTGIVLVSLYVKAHSNEFDNLGVSSSACQYKVSKITHCERSHNK